jgi:hypothetical protein
METLEKYLGVMINYDSKIEKENDITFQIKDYPSIYDIIPRIIYKKNKKKAVVKFYYISSCNENDDNNSIEKFKQINNKYEEYYNIIKSFDTNNIIKIKNKFTSKENLFLIFVTVKIDLELLKIERINRLYDSCYSYLNNKEKTFLTPIVIKKCHYNLIDKNLFSNKCNYYIFMASEVNKEDKLEMINLFFQYLSDNVQMLISASKIYETILFKIEEFIKDITNDVNRLLDINMSRKVMLTFLYFLESVRTQIKD